MGRIISDPKPLEADFAPPSLLHREKERKIKALLNLEEIEVYAPDSWSSSTCGAHCFFSIKCEGRHGYTEDPDFGGATFEVLDTKREGDEVILKMRAKVGGEGQDG
ncbi:MAG: hypothetical protein COS08_06805 [Euryarchaeota archaeon CG01_land_8_20_14_3_00_38_12]|nr:MAG: hypothetical protein COS08_06805 [Euryarchaeota archaeon CG01_land_8_20_14_3_00_38_12]PJB22120.1 MAG: hypothetical protein CO114_01730 [Euryarchaeota archaeon CG_4_9_14_3_um_filter_38_12]